MSCCGKSSVKPITTIAAPVLVAADKPAAVAQQVVPTASSSSSLEREPSFVAAEETEKSNEPVLPAEIQEAMTAASEKAEFVATTGVEESSDESGIDSETSVAAFVEVTAAEVETLIEEPLEVVPVEPLEGSERSQSVGPPVKLVLESVVLESIQEGIEAEASISPEEFSFETDNEKAEEQDICDLSTSSGDEGEIMLRDTPEEIPEVSDELEIECDCGKMFFKRIPLISRFF